MKSSAMNVSIAQRMKQAIVLALAIFFGMIFSLSAEAKSDDHRFGKKSVSEIKRTNKRYSNACKLLEAKRNFKPSKKVKKVKWR